VLEPSRGERRAAEGSTPPTHLRYAGEAPTLPMADFVASATGADYDASRASEFRPTRAVVLSEMSTRDKEKYYKLLIESGARFYLDQGQTDEIYIANLRMLAPGVKK